MALNGSKEHRKPFFASRAKKACVAGCTFQYFLSTFLPSVEVKEQDCFGKFIFLKKIFETSILFLKLFFYTFFQIFDIFLILKQNRRGHLQVVCLYIFLMVVSKVTRVTTEHKNFMSKNKKGMKMVFNYPQNRSKKIPHSEDTESLDQCGQYHHCQLCWSFGF